MLEAGQVAILVSIDPARLRSSFAGREFDGEPLAALPAATDPCGEYGEFHTFAYAGPAFRWPLRWRRGEIVARDGFVFADVLPLESVAAPA
jgi:diphthamide synthase (EF-2-diphthine--ammonia ligase)